MTASLLDPGRTRKALRLNVEPLTDDAYVVTGGREPHTVTTAEVPWACDCRDATYRPDVRCKHTTAVYFDRQLAGAVRDALRSALGAT